jgi:hypothetical protein
MPNKTAARIFLKAVYGISKEEAEKMLPTGKRVRAAKYKTVVEREFLGPRSVAPATTISVSTATEEEKLEEVKPAQQQPPKTAPKKGQEKKTK